jgi:hypothetical protein
VPFRVVFRGSCPEFVESNVETENMTT